MRITRRLRWQLLFQSGTFMVLLALLTALIAYFAHDYRFERDITRSARNTLSAATLGMLRQMQGPLRVTAYAVRQDASGANVHKMIGERVRAYQRTKRDLELQLIDPREQPKLAAEAGLRSPNALVIEYQRRSEQIPLGDFNEQNFANALVRLLRGANNQVLWLDGHGERRLDGLANHDLGSFGHQLRQKGFSVSSINLGLAQDVPVNAALLVVTQPQVDLQPGETAKLLAYLNRGGNLLWLIDTEPLRGLPSVGMLLNDSGKALFERLESKPAMQDAPKKDCANEKPNLAVRREDFDALLATGEALRCALQKGAMWEEAQALLARDPAHPLAAWIAPALPAAPEALREKLRAVLWAHPSCGVKANVLGPSKLDEALRSDCWRLQAAALRLGARPGPGISLPGFLRGSRAY